MARKAKLGDESCENCYFVRSDNGGTPSHFCHFNAPATSDGEYNAHWPEVSKNDWCGDWTRDLVSTIVKEKPKNAE